MRSQRASVRTVEVDRSRVNEKKFDLMFYALTPYVLCYILLSCHSLVYFNGLF